MQKRILFKITHILYDYRNVRFFLYFLFNYIRIAIWNNMFCCSLSAIKNPFCFIQTLRRNKKIFMNSHKDCSHYILIYCNIKCVGQLKQMSTRFFSYLLIKFNGFCLAVTIYSCFITTDFHSVCISYCITGYI